MGLAGHRCLCSVPFQEERETLQGHIPSPSREARWEASVCRYWRRHRLDQGTESSGALSELQGRRHSEADPGLAAQLSRHSLEWLPMSCPHCILCLRELSCFLGEWTLGFPALAGWNPEPRVCQSCGDTRGL